jgi:hypothetical protein
MRSMPWPRTSQLCVCVFFYVMCEYLCDCVCVLLCWGPGAGHKSKFYKIRLYSIKKMYIPVAD